MDDNGDSANKTGRPPLPTIELAAYVVSRLNAGESMKDIAKDSFRVKGIVSPKPGTLEYDVAQEVAGRNIEARYREASAALAAPWAKPGHAVPLFNGRPLKMPASVTENVVRKRGRPKKQPPVT